MADQATAQLDNLQFVRALAVIERETPTAKESWWFRRLQQVVWSALLLSALWVGLAQYCLARYGDIGPAYPALLLAVACYAALVPLLAACLGMIRKLLRAARLRRSLRLAARLGPHFRERRHRHRIYNSFTLVMSVVGFVSLAISVLLLFLELPEPDATGIAIVGLMFAWGLSCIAVDFMARGTERLQVISELRAALVAGKASAPEGEDVRVTIPVEHYDALSGLERAQILSDRRRSIARGMQETSDDYALRLSRSFRDAARALDGAALTKVHGALFRLAREPADAPAARDFPLPVPETSVEVLCRVDHERREVLACSLRELATSRRKDDDPKGTS